MNEILGASTLGFGFNILGNNNLSNGDLASATKAIVATPTGTGGGQYTDPNSQTTFSVPNNVTVRSGNGNQTQEASAIVASSQQAFQSQLTAKFAVSGSYNGFSGAFNAAFSNEAQSQTIYWYCLASGSFQSWTVLLQQASPNNLSSGFTSDGDYQAVLAQTSFTPKNQQTFFEFFRKWGTHYIDQITMGGNFNYFVAVETSYSSDETTINANLNLEY